MTEAKIYKEVKWVLDLYFDARIINPKSRFIQPFKCYYPDILVPDLGVAIEFKFIKAKESISKYIDEIIVYAVNYTGGS